MKENEQAFLPVIIGSDQNAYGLARACYEEYGVKSLLLEATGTSSGVKRLLLGQSRAIETQNSKIIVFKEIENLSVVQTFLQELEKIAKEYKNKRLILLVCTEEYAKLVIEHKQMLQKDYIIPYIDKPLMDQLLLKEDFYKLCDEYGYKYPKTVVIPYENDKTNLLPLEYPLIIKPSDTAEYSNCEFLEKKKVYIVQDEIEKNTVLQAIYRSSYKGNLIVQEFIPGDDTQLRVVHVYVGKDKKVKLMYLGNTLLENPTPSAIGNSTVLVTTYDKKLMDRLRFILEDIGYSGFGTFDIKVDPRNGEYNLLELNIRNGASNYSVTASGHNFMKVMIDDYVFQKDQSLTYDSSP